MKIIYNNFIPVPPFSAIMLFGVTFARRKYKPLSCRTINHEKIHVAQAKECGGWFKYYLTYLRLWLKYRYAAHPMEIEAYGFEQCDDYLAWRKPFSWKKL